MPVPNQTATSPSGPVAAKRMRPDPPLRQRVIAATVIFLPLGVTLWSATHLRSLAPSSMEVLLLAGLYLLTTFGIEAGYHRMVSHRAFQANPAVRGSIVVLGSMAAQGPVLFWAATHRKHHSNSDDAGDPHSPHRYGTGLWNALRGTWHAHCGWTFVSPVASWSLHASDLVKDRVLYRLNNWYPAWVLLGVLLPGVVDGLAKGTMRGFWMGLLWGGLVRISLGQHLGAWCVNSLCHRFGSRSFRTPDRSTNIAILALPTLGGSWHHNHHAFPSTAINRLEWWQLDPSGIAIRAMERLGLVKDVRFPSCETVLQRRTATEFVTSD